MPRKQKLNRKHSVRCEIKIPELTKAGSSVSFDIHAEGEKIGTIIVGRGSLSWFGGKRKTGMEIPWSKFAEMMDKHCYGQ